MIKTDLQGDVAYIRLLRGMTRNAFDLDAWIELRYAFQNLATTSIRAIIIESGVEGAFCAGADLRTLAAIGGRQSLVEQFRIEMGAAIGAVADMPVPVIANIQGDCFGAGVALSLACDIRVAGEWARFAITPARLGISYPLVDVNRLVALIGPGQASRLLLSADIISSAEAARIGLVEICGDSDIARSIASSIALNAPRSVGVLKRSIKAGPASDHHEFDRIFDQSFKCPEFSEGMRAFREKRRPVFVNRAR